MSREELAELKIQSKDLLDKGFIEFITLGLSGIVRIKER
jgi:hypothetical protein